MGDKARSANALNHRRQMKNNADPNNSPLLCKLSELTPFDKADFTAPKRRKRG